MPFDLPELPFARDALAPVMSAETLDFHHGKHHQAYVTKTNELLKAERDLSGASLIQVVREAKRAGNSKLFNNSAQLWNHSFFWPCLAPANDQKPGGKLAKLIEDAFGNPQALLDKLQEEAVNHFGSGWAWLVLDRGALRVTSLHDADTPIVHEGMVPLFTLDVWEHAYYIDYRNERPRFASSVLSNIVNWDFVAQNLDGQGFERANQQSEGARSPELTA
jgi:Fe-Mn family superoxide dismutase